MRPLLLSVLLIASGPIAMAAEDNGNGAFTDLARKNAINSVCPLDGKPINAQLTPIALLDQNGQQVYIGADTQACLDDMRPKTGPDAYAVIAAARANTTLKAQNHAPAAGGASSIANAPQVGSQPSDVYTPPATTLSAPTPSFGTQPTSSFGTQPGDTQPAAVAAPSTHHTAHHHETSASGRSEEDTDERQRQKKAAQRRDGDSWDGGETGAETEHHATHHSTHRHTASHPASTPSTAPSTSSPTSSTYPPASTSGSSSAFGTSSSFGGGGSSSFTPAPAPATPAPSSSGFASPPANFAPASPAFSSGSGATPAAGGAPSDPTPAPTH